MHQGRVPRPGPDRNKRSAEVFEDRLGNALVCLDGPLVDAIEIDGPLVPEGDGAGSSVLTPAFSDADGVLVGQDFEDPQLLRFRPDFTIDDFKGSLSGITGDEIAGVYEFTVAVIDGNNLVGRGAQHAQDQHGDDASSLAFTALMLHKCLRLTSGPQAPVWPGVRPGGLQDREGLTEDTSGPGQMPAWLPFDRWCPGGGNKVQFDS